MSEILQSSENATISLFFTKNGALSAVTPDPTFVLYQVSDGSIIASGTLTAQGNFYPYSFQQATSGEYQIVATTSDAAADYLSMAEIIRVGQSWIEDIDAAISSRSTLTQSDVQTALTTQGYTTTRAGYLDTLNGLVQAIWDAATSALTTAGSIGAYLLTKLGLLGTTGATVPTDDVATGDLTFYVGTDYNIADGSAKSISDDYAGSLAGATALLMFAGYTLPVTITGTAGAYVYEIECSQAQGAAIGEGDFGYSLVITLASTHKLPPRAVGTLHFLKVGA